MKNSFDNKIYFRCVSAADSPTFRRVQSVAIDPFHTFTKVVGDERAPLCIFPTVTILVDGSYRCSVTINETSLFIVYFAPRHWYTHSLPCYLPLLRNRVVWLYEPKVQACPVIVALEEPRIPIVKVIRIGRLCVQLVPIGYQLSPRRLLTPLSLLLGNKLKNV